jgi:hypothetical protein
MARQVGIFPIAGKLGNVVFYEGKEGFLVKTKGSLDKERVQSDPAFEGSRKANIALSKAAKATKLLRRAMGPEALKLAETRMAGKMNGKMMRVLKEDECSPNMDEKLISRGNLGLLVGHAWHMGKPIRNCLLAGYKVEMHRGLGEMEVRFDEFLASRDLNCPEGASHYEFFAVGALLDFEAEEMQNDQVCSGKLPINQVVRSIRLTCLVGANRTLPMVLGLGIAFYQEVNAKAYATGGACFEIVGVLGCD